MDKKIKPYRCLPSKPPGPKFQCCTKLHIVSSALGFDFCPPAPNAQPKGNIEIWGYCRGDDNTAGVWFHRPSTVRGRGCSLAHKQQHIIARGKICALVRKSCVFKFPNSKLYFLFYYLFLLPIPYLIPITCVSSGKPCSGVCKRRQDYIFSLFLNAWTEQTHFDCKNTDNRN